MSTTKTVVDNISIFNGKRLINAITFNISFKNEGLATLNYTLVLRLEGKDNSSVLFSSIKNSWACGVLTPGEIRLFSATHIIGELEQRELLSTIHNISPTTYKLENIITGGITDLSRSALIDLNVPNAKRFATIKRIK